MDMSEILKKYEREWLLIEYQELDENLNVIAGEVIAHSPKKEDIYKLLMQTKGRNVAIEYAGNLVDDVAVML